VRELKFRGKRRDKWYYGYYSTEVVGGYMHPEHGDIEGEVCHFIMDEGMDNHEVDPETVGQFTGLHDRNGREIYEGDVLRIKGRYFRKTIQENMVVEYDESRAWFGVLDALHTVSLNNFDCENDIEVIGNIFQNKELLNDSQHSETDSDN
jgi:uncharacterized phage protein (TIGR01671 family)